jgi:hypothetical protein
VNVQVRDSVADHRGVHMLGAGDLAQGPARPSRPPADALGFGFRQIGQTWRVPAWFDKQVTQVRAGTAVA